VARWKTVRVSAAWHGDSGMGQPEIFEPYDDSPRWYDVLAVCFLHALGLVIVSGILLLPLVYLLLSI